ncbi:hypothetical protein GCM10007939_14950 [Amylibacter marinus]|uniref:DUF1523 domain-containing protein n=1 Tax=Amylibacter marinus TaxID=1475483 RepID=A0ABQ5VVC8_9RHOB|nr:DUF1523 family protein [Amylibacter marinus]GLQ35212.1 hypothetical protein GCM10007939_14950 [Amylibacter marinus]
MRIVKWIFIISIFSAVGLLFHYTLPQRDVVRVTGTEVIRSDFNGWNRLFYAQQDSGNAVATTRDVRLINTVYPDGSVMVFRNEDTGWFNWPPYFKTNSSDVSAHAENLQSTAEAPKWVSIKHYGWRFSPWSIYPNATRLDAVDDPDATFFPLFNTLFFIFISLIMLGLFRLAQRFKRRRIDPVLDDMGETWDSVEAGGTRIGNAIRGMFKKLGGR